jgi:hypothetical protein
LPSDPQDESRDRKTDERVRDPDSESHDRGRRDYAERDEPVNVGVMTVSNERWAVEPIPSP